jgi:hypothetical protein
MAISERREGIFSFSFHAAYSRKKSAGDRNIALSKAALRAKIPAVFASARQNMWPPAGRAECGFLVLGDLLLSGRGIMIRP